MIEPEQVRKRASQIYSDIKKRSAPKLWQNGRSRGKVRWHGVSLPYSSEQFGTWLLTKIGCNAFLCPYCNAPLDVLSMTLDHDVPLHGGGTNEFPNLVPCCADCNELKGAMTGKDFRQFREMLRSLSRSGEADVLKRLRFGLHGMRMSQLSHAKKAGKTKPSLVVSDEPF